jgi:hypothetical protein
LLHHTYRGYCNSDETENKERMKDRFRKRFKSWGMLRYMSGIRVIYRSNIMKINKKIKGETKKYTCILL